MTNLPILNIDAEYELMKEDVFKYEQMCSGYEEELRLIRKERDKLKEQLRSTRQFVSVLLEEMRE